jgi:hypothetical protein
VAVSSSVSTGDRILIIGFGVLVLIALPLWGAAWLLYSLLVDLPRETYRHLRWALDPRLSAALPGRPAFVLHVADVERLLASADELAVQRIQSLRPETVPYTVLGDVDRVVRRAPASVRDAFRAVRLRAEHLLYERAAHEDPGALVPDPTLWGIEVLEDPSWLAAERGLVAACAATQLGEAVDAATREEWLGAWTALTN